MPIIVKRHTLAPCKASSLQEGFSLIELSIILAVISIISVGMMEWFPPPIEDEIKKQKITEERLTNINNALQAFYAQNERLPCSARINLADANAAFGVEYCIGQSAADDAVNGLNARSRPNVGTVPYRTLGIGIENTIDGWGRRFTYAVSSDDCPRNFATATARCNDPILGRQYFRSINKESPTTTTNPKVRLRLVTPAINDNTEEVTIQDVLYVIISHGPNGGCAYLPTGNAMPCNAAWEGYANSYADTITAAVPQNSLDFQDLRQSGDAAFSGRDDIVSYRTYQQFVSGARATYFSP